MDVSPQAKKLPGRKGIHQEITSHPSGDNWIKALLSKALPTRLRPSHPHCKSLPSGTYTSPLASSIRGQTEEESKKHNLTAAKTKTILQKLDRMKKQKVMSQMKAQDKTPEKQLNEVETGNLPEKKFRIMVVKII